MILTRRSRKALFRTTRGGTAAPALALALAPAPVRTSARARERAAAVENQVAEAVRARRAQPHDALRGQAQQAPQRAPPAARRGAPVLAESSSEEDGGDAGELSSDGGESPHTRTRSAKRKRAPETSAGRRARVRIREVIPTIAASAPSGGYWYAWGLQTRETQELLVRTLAAEMGPSGVRRRVAKALDSSRGRCRASPRYTRAMRELDERAEALRRARLRRSPALEEGGKAAKARRLCSVIRSARSPKREPARAAAPAAGRGGGGGAGGAEAAEEAEEDDEMEDEEEQEEEEEDDEELAPRRMR